jgi:glycosyltransferase involved in cell wall biosynthesis
MTDIANVLKFSLIVPVYNRTQEIEELLGSLVNQKYTQFETLIVEDGSTSKCDQIVKKFSKQLDIKYFFKPNSGPGLSRNYGCEKAEGNYFIFLDSDCIVPPGYLNTVKQNLESGKMSAFGGPDKDHASFSNLQKAINYSMTSFFTTGGIRGGSEKMDKFYPRSFNMGFSKEVFQKTGGFSKMRFGEDIDMSIRIFKSGFNTHLIQDAFVYHKRRTSLRQFYKQVYNSGVARINLYIKYPESLKIIHFLPAVFTVGLVVLLLGTTISPLFLAPILLHILLLFIHASTISKSMKIGVMSILTSYYQLIGYGLGFIDGFWNRVLLRKGEFSAFSKNFYK